MCIRRYTFLIREGICGWGPWGGCRTVPSLERNCSGKVPEKLRRSWTGTRQERGEATWETMADRDVPQEAPVQGRSLFSFLSPCGSNKVQVLQSSLVGWGHFLPDLGFSCCLPDWKDASRAHHRAVRRNTWSSTFTSWKGLDCYCGIWGVLVGNIWNSLVFKLLIIWITFISILYVDTLISLNLVRRILPTLSHWARPKLICALHTVLTNIFCPHSDNRVQSADQYSSPGHPLLSRNCS